MSYNCPPKDEIGKMYNLWKVIAKADQPEGLKNQGAYWLCECQCPLKTRRIIRGGTLRQGLSKSCGCYATEIKKRIRKQDAPFISVFRKVQQSALKRNIQCALTLQDIKELVLKDCHYCGALPSNTDKRLLRIHNFYFNGIDRVDNNQGYIMNNCVPCCSFCNTIKSTKTQQAFFEHIRLLYHRNCL